MNVLIACEKSGRVREAFIKQGHNATSIDLYPTDIPGNHIIGDVINHIASNSTYDLMIAFPPCTHLAVSGARWFKNKIPQQKAAIKFFLDVINVPICKIAVENPVSIMSTHYRKPDQIIQPFQFGDPYKKTTCLWLKNLPKLKHTNIVTPRIVTFKDGSRFSADYGWSTNKIKRATTYQGIADAMAVQWG